MEISKYQIDLYKTLSLFVQNLKFICRLLIPVDEAKPHGGGVWVEKLKLKKNIYLTCCLLSFIIKDLVLLYNQTATIEFFT